MSIPDIRLIPFVCGAGASTAGCEHGPGYLYDAGLAGALSHERRQVRWDVNPHHIYEAQEPYYLSLPDLGTPERRAIVMENCRDIAERVERAVSEGATPITVGGDHAIAAGSIAGFARAKKAHGRIGVIWVDAHADLNTFEGSVSKAMHGMSLAALLGMGDSEFASIGGSAAPVLKPEHVAYVGLRDVEPQEMATISAMNIKAFSMENVLEQGAAHIFEKALAHVTKETDYLILSIDLDAFDPALAPAVGTPVGQGLRRREMFVAYRRLLKEHRVDMIELVELNPTLDGAKETASLARDILNTLL